MRSWWIGVAAVLLAALMVGCGGGSGSNDTPAATGSLGGLAADVTKAVESGNSTQLLELQDLAVIPCAAAPATGALLCPTGTTAGTPVPALIQDSGCKRNHAASEADQRALWDELLAQSWTQYAVAKSGGQWGDIAGIEAVIIFEVKGSPELDLQVGITGNGVRAISRGCGGTPATDAAQFSDFLVPPPGR
jgi:hypothetical protein